MRLFAKFLLVAGLFQGCVVASESGQVDPMDPEPQVQVEITRPIYVDPVNKENCDVWVKIRFEKTLHIFDTKLEILDSKPTGEYNDIALKALLSYVSDGHHSPTNSRVFVRHGEDGSKEQFFTFFKRCYRKVAARD